MMKPEEEPPMSPPLQATSQTRVERPWGWFETLAIGNGYLVKRLHIHAGRRLSLQRHLHRSEHWVVVAGMGRLECGGACIPAYPGQTLTIPARSLHRAGAEAEGENSPPGGADLVIIEVQRGADLREDDIERFEDDFGRVLQSCNPLIQG